MPFKIERNDITLIHADAIVNAANETLLGGGGVDGAIHHAAGPRLLEECKTLGGCRTGEAKITKGYNLPAKYIIHTVGPVWGTSPDDEKLLRACYSNSLAIAAEHGFESIAFPLISSGAYRCPKDIAYRLAKEEILSFLRESDMEVTLVLFDREALRIPEEEKEKIESYINDNYVKEKERRFSRNRRIRGNRDFGAESMHPVYEEPEADYCVCYEALPDEIISEKKKADTSGQLFVTDESFSEMLLRLIDEKGIKDSECYYKANRDRKLFSKIRGNKDYRPSKETAIAFAVALELDLGRTEELLRKAGFSLSDSILSDVIVKACIRDKKYDIININELLFHYDQKLL